MCDLYQCALGQPAGDCMVLTVSWLLLQLQLCQHSMQCQMACCVPQTDAMRDRQEQQKASTQQRLPPPLPQKHAIACVVPAFTQCAVPAVG
jgi:hypothetical protein